MMEGVENVIAFVTTLDEFVTGRFFSLKHALSAGVVVIWAHKSEQIERKNVHYC